jgi:hypothetical protein
MRSWASQGLVLGVLAGHAGNCITNVGRRFAPPGFWISCFHAVEIAQYGSAKAGGQAHRGALFRCYCPPQSELDQMRVRPHGRTTERLSGGRTRWPSSIEQAGALWDVARRQRVLCHAFYIGLGRVEAWNEHWDQATGSSVFGKYHIGRYWRLVGEAYAGQRLRAPKIDDPFQALVEDIGKLRCPTVSPDEPEQTLVRRNTPSVILGKAGSI